MKQENEELEAKNEMLIDLGNPIDAEEIRRAVDKCVIQCG